MNEKYQRNPWEWTDDEVIAACLDYHNRTEVMRNNMSAYVCVSYRNLWDRLTWINDRSGPRRHKLTDEAILEESRKYAGEGRGAFQRAESALYAAAYRRGLLERMPWLDDERGRTTAELVAEARKHACLADFRKADPGGYAVLRKRGALEGTGLPETGERSLAAAIREGE